MAGVVFFFMLVMSKVIPSKLVKIKHDVPYFNGEIKSLLKQKLKAFQQASKHNSDRLWS